MENVQHTPITGSMPISMAVQPKPTTETTASSSTEKNLDYFRCEFDKATLTLYRSTKKVADLLLDARIALSPDDFQALIGELQFDYSTVCKLIKSASNFRLNDPKNQALLPESWTVRYEIMMMKEETFRSGVKKGIIHPNCTLADLKKLREQLEAPKRKRGSATAKPKGKDSTAATAETPKATQVATKADEPEPDLKKAAVKAPVNNPGLRVVEIAAAADVASASPTATATATAMATTTAMGHIAIVLSKELAEQHVADLDRLMASIEAVVKDYDFIGGVGVQVTA
jgi:hypothetical protein